MKLTKYLLSYVSQYIYDKTGLDTYILSPCIINWIQTSLSLPALNISLTAKCYQSDLELSQIKFVMAYVRNTQFRRLGKRNLSDTMESTIPCLHAIQQWF
jgi:hypothetical protein